MGMKFLPGGLDLLEPDAFLALLDQFFESQSLLSRFFLDRIDCDE